MGQAVRQLLPDSEGIPKRIPEQISSLSGRESVNIVQIHALMVVINAYMAFLSNIRAVNEDPPIVGGSLDGGVKAAAEGTFIQLCNRVDAIVEDSSRWRMDEQNLLEASVLALYSEQREFIQYQRQAVALMQSPHVRFHPVLVHLTEGKWAALLRSDVGEPSIIGFGETPEAALRDFDLAFTEKKYEKTNEKMDGSGGKIPERKSSEVINGTTGKKPRKNPHVSRKKTPKTS